jgi:hypothetical protein
MKPPCRCRGRGALPLNVARGCGVSGALGQTLSSSATVLASALEGLLEEEPLTRYELLPRLTTRFTLAPRTSFFPALGLCEITRPFRTVFE